MSSQRTTRSRWGIRAVTALSLLCAFYGVFEGKVLQNLPSSVSTIIFTSSGAKEKEGTKLGKTMRDLFISDDVEENQGEEDTFDQFQQEHGKIEDDKPMTSLQGNSRDSLHATHNEAELEEKNERVNKPKLWPTSLIHDKTMKWDPDVYRPWLDPDLKPEDQPPAMILYTNLGWNQPDQTKAMMYTRSIRETELFTGVINHPWFHPTLWEDLQKNSTLQVPTNIRYYIFSDLQQCMDSNYPIYGGGKINNADGAHGRNTLRHSFGNPFGHAPVLQSRLLTDPNVGLQGGKVKARNVHFDCRGNGVPGRSNPTNRFNGTSASWPLSVGSLSSLISNVNDEWDFGLPGPMPKPAPLTEEQERDIASCEAETKREFYVVYAGNYRNGRNGDFNARFGGARYVYGQFNDNKRIFISRYFHNEFSRSELSKYSYEDVLRKTVFSLAPRGDNKFSYRFSELMSAGGIPVVHADDWVWPFRPELVDWSECAVIMPEKDAGNTTLQYLDSISVEKRCKMRQACYRIYKNYLETPSKIVNGIVKSLEAAVNRPGGPMKLQGVRCDSFTLNPRDCNLQRRIR